MEKEVFTYQYSAKNYKEIEQIRSKYVQQENKLETLRRLDARVQMAGTARSLALGIGGALVFGVGLCCGLDVLAGGVLGAVPLALVGSAAMIAAYPLHRHLERKTKEALTPEILRLSDEIMAQGNG